MSAATAASSQLQDFRRAEDLFRADYAYFSSVFDELARACEAIRGRSDSPLAVSGSSHVVEVGEQRRLPPSILRREGRSGARRRARGKRGCGSRGKGMRTRVDFFGTRAGGGACGPKARPPIVTVANNVLAHVPDMNDFVGGSAALFKLQRRRHLRVPASAQPDRGGAVRHDLPRALLVLLVAHGATPVSRGTGRRVFDVEELPTHGGSLRIFAPARRTAPCGAPRSTQIDRHGAGGRSGPDRHVSRDSPRRSASAKREMLELLHRGAAGREVDRRLWRTREGEHPVELLRHRSRLCSTTGRSKSAQAGQISAWYAYPESRAPEAIEQSGRITS